MTEERIEDWKSQAARWLFGQPFNNVLLIALLSVVVYGSWYCITMAIPSHLRQIQEGYEKIIEINTKEQDRLIQTYDKWFDLKQTTAGTTDK